MKSLFIPLLLALATLTSAHTPEEWKSRTIYQLLTDRFAKTDGDSTPCADFSNYCGGTFQGIINNLDYIAGMGFDAIWISPIVANMPNNYHGYAAENIYQINPYFGTSDDLKNLVNACHEKDIWVMVDVVGNHMGCLTSPNVFADKVPFNDSSYYHTDVDCGNVDINNEQQRETCWLSQLADLDQDNDFVRSTLLSWISDIVSTYNIDGLRIDTVPYVNPSFWTDFTQASGVYTVGEVFNGYLPFCASFQGPVSGILNYPYFFALRQAFQQYNSMYGLQTYFQSATGWPDQTLLGNFVDNHDNARFLNYKGDHTAFKSALAFSLSTVGIPIVYYGSEQAYGGGNDPNNREPLWTNMNTTSEIYVFLKQVIAIRKQTQFYLYDQIQRYADDSFYAFTRGNYFFAFTNHGYNLGRTITYHPYADGTVLCNLMYSGDCVTVSSGSFQVDLNNGEVKIYAPKQSTDDKQEEKEVAEVIKQELMTQETVETLNRVAQEKIQMIQQEQLEIQASTESEDFKTNALKFLDSQVNQLTAEIQLRTYQYKGLVYPEDVKKVESDEEKVEKMIEQVDAAEEEKEIEELMSQQFAVELSNESEEEKEAERKELADQIEKIQGEIQVKSLEAIGLVTPSETEKSDSSDAEIEKFIEEEKQIEASNGQVDVSEQENKINELLKEQMMVEVSNQSEEEKNIELKQISDAIEKLQNEIEVKTYQYQGLAAPSETEEVVQVDTIEEEKAIEDLMNKQFAVELSNESEEEKDAERKELTDQIEKIQGEIQVKSLEAIGLITPSETEEVVQADTTEEEKAIEDLMKAEMAIELGNEDQEIKDGAVEIIGNLIEEYQEKIKAKAYRLEN